MEKCKLILTMCLHINAFRIGSIRIYVLPSWKCLFSVHISNVCVSMHVNSMQQDQVDFPPELAIQSSRSSILQLFPFLKRFLMRLILWIVRFIDIRVDNVVLQIQDESVLR